MTTSSPLVPDTSSRPACRCPSPADSGASPGGASARGWVGDLVGCLVEHGERRYILERLLNAGGMGEVYLATRVMAGGHVEWRAGEQLAVKVVRRDMAALFGGNIKPFLDEARLHLCLDHPNVPHARGLVEKDGTLFLLMEHLEGWDLRALLNLARAQGRSLPEATVCNIFAQVADALGYVHRATDPQGRPLHIVHRDVSPSNIFISTAGDVKLLDFGLAFSTLEGRLATCSADNSLKGKLKYLSPEQVGRQKLDGRSDLFSMGCILVEALTGKHPFDRSRGGDVLKAIQGVTHGRVERALRGMPGELKAICHRLLAREPQARFGTGKEVADALRTYASRKGYLLDSRSVAREVEALERLALGEEASAGAPPSPSPSPSPAPRQRTGRVKRDGCSGLPWVGVALVLAAALALLALAYLWCKPPPGPGVVPAPSGAEGLHAAACGLPAR